MDAETRAQQERLLELIEVGDRVTIRTGHGQEITGKALFRGQYGWLLTEPGKRGGGMGLLAEVGNIVHVKQSRNRKPDHLAKFLFR